MSIITIIHNPRCSKSREALSLLEGKDNLEVVEYLKDGLTVNQLKEILKKLNISASDLLRKGENDYKEQIKGKELTEDEVVNLMVQYPKLIERPIIIQNDKAIIGRPPSLVVDFVK